VLLGFVETMIARTQKSWSRLFRGWVLYIPGTGTKDGGEVGGCVGSGTKVGDGVGGRLLGGFGPEMTVHPIARCEYGSAEPAWTSKYMIEVPSGMEGVTTCSTEVPAKADDASTSLFL